MEGSINQNEIFDTSEQTAVSKAKGVTGSTLKIIAIIAMFIDHFAAIVLDGYLRGPMSQITSTEDSLAFLSQYGGVYYTDMALRCIGRFGFPIFAFLLIEGFIHTRNIGKYIRNLAIFSLVSELPFNLGFSSKLFYAGYQNVFFTLTIGVAVITGIKYLGEEKKWSEKLAPLFYLAILGLGATLGYLVKGSNIGSFMAGFGLSIPFYAYIVAGAVVFAIIMLIRSKGWDADAKNTFTASTVCIIAGIFLAEFLKTDYSGCGVLTIVVMYYFRNSYKKRMGFGCLVLTCMSVIEAFAFFMMIPATKYNGQRGIKSKYFFYIFYPAHILILYLVTLALGYTGFAIR